MDIIFNFFVCMPGINFKYRYPFLPLFGALSAGILCNHLQGISWGVFFLLLFVSSFILVFPNLLPDSTGHINRQRRFKSCCDLFLLSTIFTLGSLLSRQEPLPVSSAVTYQMHLRCEESLPQGNYILSGHSTRLFLSRFHTMHSLRPGDSLHFQARILPLPENSNPGEFSYTHYLQQKDVYYKVIPSSDLVRNGHSRSIRSVFEDFRQTLLDKTARLFPDTTVCMLVNALTLGYKNDLDKNLQNLFVRTGTIHLLAVSGLHAGAIYLLLTGLFRTTGIPRRRTDLLTIPLLWCYVCLTGLSPSAIRAAVILTFIAAGKTFERDYTPLNSIAASAFFSLLLEPHLIGSISFLMSYCAYSGIIIIYPFLNRFGNKLPTFPAKLWSLCCISLAAQLPTLPIAAYYFHTVNVNGFLINLLAIPLATFILYTSVILLLLPLFIGSPIALALSLVCNLLFETLRLFESVSLNIPGLYPTTGHLFFIYLNLVLFIFFILRPSKTTLYSNIAGLCLFLAFNCSHNLFLSTRKEIIVFNHYRHSTILLNDQGHYSLLHSTLPDSGKIKPYILKNKLKPLVPHSGTISNGQISGIQGFFSPQYKISILGTTANNIREDTDVLIVTHNALPESLSPERTDFLTLLITDGSNTRFNVRKWKEFCHEKNIIFHDTAETGSISLPLK